MNPKDVYSFCYRDPRYCMGSDRLERVFSRVASFYQPGSSVLDVGCGRGELLAALADDDRRDWPRLIGLEIVPELCGEFDGYFVRRIVSMIDKLPSSDVVVSSDVLEHVKPDDTEAAASSLWEATEHALVVHVAWFPTVHVVDGQSIDLHCNKRSPDEWLEIFRRVSKREPHVDWCDMRKQMMMFSVKR